MTRENDAARIAALESQVAAWKRAAEKWFAWHLSCMPPAGEAMWKRAIAGTAQERRAATKDATMERGTLPAVKFDERDIVTVSGFYLDYESIDLSCREDRDE